MELRGKRMKKWFSKGLALVAFMALSTGLLGADRLQSFDQGYITDAQAAFHSVSHKEALVNTIDRLLDCSAGGRIETAMVGLSSVPEWVVSMWQRQETEVKEVSVSRYSMALDIKNPEIKTDFYRFRATRTNGEISETLLQDIHKDKKAARIFSFINGDPTGMEKALQNTLEGLLSIVEEGFVQVAHPSFEECPIRVVKVWSKNADLKARRPVVERFDANHAGGETPYYRLSSRENSFEQTILIHDGEMVYNNVNGTIVTE